MTVVLDSTEHRVLDVVELPGALAVAIVDAAAELSDIERSRTANTGSYSYRYAELADVLAAVRPILKAHQLAHLQLVETQPFATGVHVTVRTLLVHESGHTLTSPPLALTVPSTDPQRVGSAVTYARRYSLMATLGIAAEDDDGQAARTQQTQQQTRPTTGRTEHEAQARELLNAATPELRTAVQRAFREHFGVSLSNLPRDRHAEALSFVMEQLTVPDEDGYS